MIDLRFAAFVRITRDTGLRSLLVNHADWIDHDRIPCGAAPETCYLVLRWAPADRTGTDAGYDLLTAGVHLPLQRSNEHLFLDFVLERVHAALMADSTDEPITTRRLGTSCAFVDTGADTIVKTGTFEISPASTRRTDVALRQLTPWIGGLPGRCRPSDAIAGAASLN
jgi:hypothetical protein